MERSPNNIVTVQLHSPHSSFSWVNVAVLEKYWKKLCCFLFLNFSVLFQESGLQEARGEFVADSAETSGRQASQGRSILKFAVEQFCPIKVISYSIWLCKPEIQDYDWAAGMGINYLNYKKKHINSKQRKERICRLL